MLCASCGQANAEGASFCRNCGNPLSIPASAKVATLASATSPVEIGVSRLAVNKTPTVALIFAVFWLGQFYNGDFKRGVLLILLESVALVFSAPTFGATALLFWVIWLWGIVNAYNVASRKTPLWS